MNVSAKTLLFLSLWFSWCLAEAQSPSGSPSVARVVESFDSNWEFFKGEALGAETNLFDDAHWRQLDVPHDWSIEGPFDARESAGGAGAFLPTGIGWYRRHFKLSTLLAAKEISIEFDGVMANSDVWINGFHLAHRPNGSVSFGYSLNGHLHFGSEENVVAVRVDNSAQPASRWYAGAGIYRHVRLVATDSLSLNKDSLFLTTPNVSSKAASLQIQGTLINQAAVSRVFELQFTLYSPTGKTAQLVNLAEQTIPANGSSNFSQTITLKKPQLWDLDHPDLYRLQVAVSEGKKIVDDLSVAIGVREFHFAAETGFWLNEHNIKLKGVCLHEDASAFGVAVPQSALARRLIALKALGVNALRTAHGPPSPEFLNLCDRLGFVVMDELFDCWTVAKNPYDYHLYFNQWATTDARDTVLRDRNHPSVMVYSAGNEIHDTPDAALSKKILSELLAVFHDNDPTRPVTQALFRPNVSHDFDDGLADMLDVIGTNYRFNEIVAAHEAQPSRKILGTENGHTLPAWLAVRDHAAYAGEFIWTGADYLGESDAWPYVASGSGLLDRTDLPRADGEIFRSWWLDKPSLFVARRIAPTHAIEGDPGFVPLRQRQALYADWTPHDLGNHQEEIEVDSNCERVELFLNGQSLGAQPLAADLSPRIWEAAFAPGTLKAVGMNGGKVVVEQNLRTAAQPARIELTADQTILAPGWEHVDYVAATVVDANGVIVPEAATRIAFRLSGPGVIAAVDSADNASHEPFHATIRRAYQGRCYAIIRANASSGTITLQASAPGLSDGIVSIQTADAPY